MDSDFMNNLTNMLNNGNIPEDLKSKMNQFINQNNGQNQSNTHSTNQNSENMTSDNSNTINPEMLQNLMKMFASANSQNSTNSSQESSNSSSGIDMNTILKMKSIMEKMQSNKEDPRANLLRSLKPYLKESRKTKVDQYVQLLNMAKVMEMFNENGGEKIK